MCLPCLLKAYPRSLCEYHEETFQPSPRLLLLRMLWNSFCVLKYRQHEGSLDFLNFQFWPGQTPYWAWLVLCSNIEGLGNLSIFIFATSRKTILIMSDTLRLETPRAINSKHVRRISSVYLPFSNDTISLSFIISSNSHLRFSFSNSSCFTCFFNAFPDFLFSVSPT